ncbi:MAG TPA: response regulator transcription factor [Burkholderiales bacterium]|nr:response regulator transcription factor [Burkholderiales bacterium]
MIRVFITDDHAIVRQGLKQIIADTRDIAFAGEADTGAHAVQGVRDTPCDVLLLDISLPDRNGIEVLKQVKREHPKLPVLMLSMHMEREFAIRALKAGAAGYLTKQSAPMQLVAAIRHVAAGRKYLTPSIAEEVANALAGNDEQSPHETLSDREYQTMCLIATGKSLSAIASELVISPKTVSVYRARVLEKLNLKNNSDITRYAIRNQLVE